MSKIQAVLCANLVQEALKTFVRVEMGNFFAFCLDPKLVEFPFIVDALNGNGHLFLFV